MLTKTSELAIQVLIYLALQEKSEPLSPRQIAQSLAASPTYLAKVASILVKASILKAYHGSLGGVKLSRPAENITLLEIVEACQGQIAGNYCGGNRKPHQVCPFHRAMLDVHQALVGTLSQWTLKNLAVRPMGIFPGGDCRMAKICPRSLIR